jgi:hypothetical protein
MSVLIRSTLLIAVLWLGSGPAALASCSPAAIGAAEIQVKAARHALARLPVDRKELPTRLDPQSQASIATMKARLGELIGAYMRCAPLDLQSKRAEQDLAGWVAERPHAPDGMVHYGDRLTFAARRPANEPHLIAITAEFAIECGTDTVLFLFAPEGHEWKEVLRWQSPPYPQINGAFASFGYDVSPPDEEGHWFLVTKTVAPWCSSTWSVIRYSVLRPRPDRVAPTVIFDAEDSIWWGGEDFGRLSVDKDEFDLRFHAGSIDLGINNRVWVRHFAVEGDEVRRTPPIAVSPRDFVDEWIVSPWDLASPWSRPDARRSLEIWHAQLRALGRFEYGAIRHCHGEADLYQIELNSGGPQNVFYIETAGQPADYQLVRVATKPDPGCGGADLLATMATQ